MHFVKLLLFVLVTLSHDVFSQTYTPVTVVVPITKDTETSLYKVVLTLWAWGTNSTYLLDLDAPFTWKECIGLQEPYVMCQEDQYDCYSSIYCEYFRCIDARSYTNPTCPSLNFTTKYGCDLCAVTPVNPISKSCELSQLSTKVLILPLTDGRNPTLSRMSNYYFVFSCAPSSLLGSLPEGVTGVAAFSWSDLAFPRQLTVPDPTEQFAICLPSSSLAPGVSFIGDGPFYFLPFPNIDIKSILSYTPMIRKTSKSLGYYVTVNKISIKGIPITLPSLKSSPAKLSTLVPYTTLRSDIYAALLASFSKATKNIPRLNTMHPFSLCMKASACASRHTNFHVPNIDLEMESGKTWTISKDNSIKDMGNGVACLAFVDGGLQVEDAIVIGTFQMENNFLFFDLANQTLGFSSSLLARGTSCSSFNTTVIG